jgi:hypothetical protein
MKKVQSADGTTIAFDQLGKGPALILVGGALEQRAMDSETAQLAPLLAQHFTVLHYDRRGRGDSTNTQPYAVEREIEDIDALITEATCHGGSYQARRQGEETSHVRGSLYAYYSAGACQGDAPCPASHPGRSDPRSSSASPGSPVGGVLQCQHSLR